MIADTKSKTPGELVKEWRERKGWTLKDLGEAAGIHHTDLCTMENGHRPIGMLCAVKLGQVMRISPKRLCLAVPAKKASRPC